jgi:DNA-binding CsgD family transcriptional regulator
MYGLGMGGSQRTAGPASLFERDAELELLDAALAAAAAGRGSLLTIQGPAGSGKTALLEAIGERAGHAGTAVRTARATELEGDFAFGGVRQLFSADDAAEAISRSSAVKAAQPVLAAGAASSSNPPPAFAVLDGLTALLAALADPHPIVLLIDDAHWLDVPTSRWLDFLRARVGRMYALVVVAVREVSMDRMPAPLTHVLTDQSVDALRLAPLTEQAVAKLLELRFGVPAQARLVAACLEATSGNAFALRELIAALDIDGAESLAAYGAHHAPDSITRSVRGRISGLSSDALPVARALAVLGDGASLHRVAVVSGVSVERAAAAIDELAAADLLAGSRPARFTHPLVRSAVEDDIAVGVRSQLHAAAADLLVAEEDDPEAVAAHLLRTDTAARTETVERLRGAATVAIRRGSPETAVVYLERAQAEPPEADQRVGLLHELGRAELLARSPAGLRHLESALQRAGDPVQRARIGVDLFDVMTLVGRWREGLQLVTRLRDELADDDPEAALALEMRAALGLIERNDDPTGEHLARIESLGRGAQQTRPLLLLVALLLALRGERCDEVAGIVSAGLGGGSFLREHTADSMLAVHAVDALIFVDALPEAAAVADAMCDNASRHGLVLGAVAGMTHRGLAALRLGDLPAAESNLRDALASAREHELLFTLPFICSYLAETLCERGDFDAAMATLAAVPEAGRAYANPASAALLWTRGSVCLARGARDDAIADLRSCGERLAEMGASNPLLHPWRSTLALALAPEDRDQAGALLSEELALARAAGLPRAVGGALHAQAQLEEGDAAVMLFEQAVEAFRDSHAALLRARALADLGAAQRRAGQITLARDSLREALDQATRSGARALVDRVTEELHICGARPRRPWLSGVEALTPSQIRVARLAARGLTNEEIATQLIISPKTVKHHLGATYRKLDITTRRELGAALADAPENG